MRISDCSSDVCSSDLQDLVVVSPDIGGVVRARALAKQLEADLAIIDKRRPRANVSEVMNIIGEVDGRTCVIMDDMVDTAGLLFKAPQVPKDRGALLVYAHCTHPAWSGRAIQRIEGPAPHGLVVTGTTPTHTARHARHKIAHIETGRAQPQTH